MRNITISLALLLAGCSSEPQRALYEGIQSAQEAQRTPFERAANPAMDYEMYRKVRAH